MTRGPRASTQGFLDLEGELPPILVSLVVKVCVCAKERETQGCAC